VTRRAPGPVLRLAMLAAALSAGALTACATTIDTSATTVVSSPPSAATVTAAPASIDERLAALAGEVGVLSERLVDNEGQTEALVRIESHWAAIRPEIDAERPELLAGFDAAIGQVRRSVERRRPADADKASKNLNTLIAALAG